MRRLFATGLLCAALTGCGGSPYDDYCGAVKSRQGELTRLLEPGGPQALLRALPAFEDLQRHAPRDVEADWRTLTKALRNLDDALAAAGVDPASYDPTAPPAGVSKAEQDRIAAAATAVGAEPTQAALTAVDQQARDVCHAPLTL